MTIKREVQAELAAIEQPGPGHHGDLPNFLVHRHGVVTERDLTTADAMVLTWLGLDMEIESGT